MGFFGKFADKFKKESNEEELSQANTPAKTEQRVEKPTPFMRLAAKQIIAVASGKGGVGKSTCAVNLAFSLQAKGKKVGLFDADIYGPSLVTMTKAKAQQSPRENVIEPCIVDGVKVVSLAMFSAPEQAQIMRGPMAGNLVKQLIQQTNWGDLDILLLDFPPGTGDVQLTLCQSFLLSGAVIITTPQNVALADVRKSISMFETLKVPVIGIIENMSYFLCESCSHKHFIFKEGGGTRLAYEYAVPLLGNVPLLSMVADLADAGANPVISKPHSPIAQAFLEIAEKIENELSVIGAMQNKYLSSFRLEWLGDERHA